MSASRMIIFIGLTVYLVALGFMLPSINELLDSNNQLVYDSSGKLVPQTEQNFTFVTSISSLPIWFNILFIVLPFTIWIIVGVTFFIPTTNAGA